MTVFSGISAFVQTALTDWLYERNLIGLAVGLVIVIVICLLYWMMRRDARVAMILALLITAGGITGFFVMAADRFLSAACGGAAVVSFLILADRICRPEKHT